MLAASLLYAWIVAPEASLEPPSGPPTIVWEAPAECPDAEQLFAQIDRFAPGLRADPSVAARVDARIELVDGRYAASVRIENQDGLSERRFDALDCQLVGDAVGLVIAVSLAPLTSVASIDAHDELAPPEHPEPEPEPEPVLVAPEATPAPEPDEAEPSSINLGFEPPDEDPTRARPRVGLRAFGGGGYGPTNTGYALVGGALSVFANRWRAELHGSYFPRRVLRRGEIGGSFDAWTVGARGCFVPRHRRLEFPLCPGLELGQVRGRGLDELPIVREASFFWAALGLGQGLWFVAHERVALGLEVQAAAALRRGAFVVEDRQVQRLAAVGVRGLAGIELRLP